MRTLNLNRRQFVVLGTATVAGMAAKLPAYATTPLSGSFVSVGYTSGRTRLRIGGRASESPTSFVDATSLLTGDPEFFRAGARMRIHGFARAEVPARPERIDVEVLFPIDGQEQRAPFYAFTSIATRERQMTANPVGFTVPAESTGTIELAIQRQQIGEPGVTERVVLPFSVNELGTAAYKLNEGLYAIAILRPEGPAPNWTSIRTDIAMTRHEKAPVRLVHEVFGETVPVSFDYFLLSVTTAASPKEPAVKGERGMAGEVEES